MMLDPSIYKFMESLGPYLNAWVALFFVNTIYKMILSILHPDRKYPYGTMNSELPGIPLTLLHTVCFVKGIMLGDIVSVLLFAWWGPGFLITAGWYLYIKKYKIPFDWTPLGYITSVGCKVNYLLFMLIYYYYDCHVIMMSFSVWIIHDQINLAWFEHNADRTRRSLEDFWLVRLSYLGCLFIALFFPDFPQRVPSLVLGSLLFVFWIAAIVKVTKQGHFYFRPGHQIFLRNIVYLSKRYSGYRISKD